MQVRDFLGSYRVRSQPFFDGLTKQLLSTSGEMGYLPTEVVKHFVSFYAEGKRIRGALMELSYRICGGDREGQILRASLAMEVLQAGLLVQDDFMDKDEIRRGLATLHASIGKRLGDGHLGNCMAVNMGDVAFFWAFKILGEADFVERNRVMAINEMCRRLIMVGYGQMLDVANSGANQISEEEVVLVHRYKTAEYTGALPLYVGALLAGEKSKVRLNDFQEYGLSLGWAFQIQDDILGIFGKEEETGKGVGTDLKEGRNTLFLTYLRKDGTKEDNDFIAGLRDKEITERRLNKARAIFTESGVLNKVEAMRESYAKRAIQAVERMEMTEED